MKVALGIYPLHQGTSFEIRGFCEVQNRGSRPWLGPVAQQAALLTTGGGILNNNKIILRITHLFLNRFNA